MEKIMNAENLASFAYANDPWAWLNILAIEEAEV